MSPLDLTGISYFIGFVVVYYSALYAMSLARRHRWARAALAPGAPGSGISAAPLVVMLIPARNEESVLGATLASLRALTYHKYLVMVLNDGSTDATSQIAHLWAQDDPSIIVVDRSPEQAGQGKSAVLNHGFALISSMLESGDPRLQQATADDILVGILDADGQLEDRALGRVIPLFADREVGQVQVGVQIANPERSFLARMQDMEFVGFSCLVQIARDRIGSSGLGGNGQFTRLSALQSLGRAPWLASALTEDLDLGLALVEGGWRTRFCPQTYVIQQGLDRWKPLIRQRTRWIQGHYQCWRHIPRLLRARAIRLRTRLDLTLYLLLVTTVVLVSYNLVLGLLGSYGHLHVTNNFLTFMPPGAGQRLVALAFALGPLIAFVATYQRWSRTPVTWWKVPAYGLAFTAYTYVWCTATIWAWTRMIMGRKNWAKTPRLAVTTSRSPDLAGDRA